MESSTLPSWACTTAAPAADDAAPAADASTSSTLPSWAQQLAEQVPNPFRVQCQDSTAGRGGRVDVTEAQLARQKQEEAQEKARIAAEVQASVAGLQRAELKRLKKETAAAARAAKQAAATAGTKSADIESCGGPSSTTLAAVAPAVVAPAAGGGKKTPMQLKAAAEREEAAAREAQLVTRSEKRAERAAKRKKKDRCCGVSPWHGCLGCIALGILASVMGSAMLAQDRYTGSGRYTGFAVACCLDALFNIGAFMFLFGPRKYCRGAFINGPVRMCVALLYWGLIGFVIALCFVPGVTKLELLAALVAMKVAWAVNLAAACGCLGSKGASAEATERQREAKGKAGKAAVKYMVSRDKNWTL